MKILLLADQAEPTLWEHLDRRRLEGVELVLACGDLPASYLSFLTCFTTAPILYVRGNHDDRYAQNPPEGCICIEDKVYVHNGVRIMGLGGSMRYRPGSHQYTEMEMRMRYAKMKLRFQLIGGVDILVTHAPARQLNDGEDLPHQGFQVFRSILDTYHPKYFLHGHVHMQYGRKYKRNDVYHDTQVINVFERYVFEF